MKTVCILFLFLVSMSFFGQTKKLDSYKNYRDTRPDYRKEVVEDISDSSNIKITGSVEWKKNKRIWCYYYDSFDMTTGRKIITKNTIITIYNRFKRNTVITRFYTNDNFTTKTRSIRNLNSTTNYNAKNEMVFKSNYDPKGLSWSGIRKDTAGDIKFVSIQDSTKWVDYEYQNGSLLEKRVTFKHHDLEDSCLIFDQNNKLIYKEINLYNKFGDPVYKEELNFSGDTVVVTKQSRVFTYDSHQNWIQSVTTTIGKPRRYMPPIKPRCVMRRKLYY